MSDREISKALRATRGNVELAAKSLAGKGPPFCMSKFVLNDKIGSGAFGEVYNVFDREKGETIALKVAFEKLENPIQNEIDVVQRLTTLQVRNIVEFRGTGRCNLLDNRVYYGMHIEDGTMESFMKHGNKLDGPAFFSLFFEMVFTLSQFSEHGFQHRDIKADNILYRNVPQAREYALPGGRTFLATGTTQPIFADFNTGQFKPDFEIASDAVSLWETVIAPLIEEHVFMDEDEEEKLQEVANLYFEVEAGKFDAVLKKIAE